MVRTLVKEAAKFEAKVALVIGMVEMALAMESGNETHRAPFPSGPIPVPIREEEGHRLDLSHWGTLQGPRLDHSVRAVGCQRLSCHRQQIPCRAFMA